MSIDTDNPATDRQGWERVRQALSIVGPKPDDSQLPPVAERLANGSDAVRLLQLLAGAREPVFRHLAMLLAARLPPPLPAYMIDPLCRLLLEGAGSDDMQRALAAVLVRSANRTSENLDEILHAYTVGLGKAQMVDRLHGLEAVVGRLPAIEELCARLEDKIKSRCPRCPISLPRLLMVKHLWLEHGLLVDGQTVREPWKMIEDWIGEYYLTRDSAVLAQCKALAQRIDPANGLERVQRLFLSNRIEDSEALEKILIEARRRRSTVCPHCFGLVPAPSEIEVRPLNASHGRLSLYGYLVEVSDRGLLTHFRLETPRGVLYHGREPGRLLTQKGALMALAGPFVVTALLLALMQLGDKNPSLLPVVVLLMLAGIMGIISRFAWRVRRPVQERAVDFAWTRLTPHLHEQGFSADDSVFLAGLAQLSSGHGRADRRSDALLRILGITEFAVATGSVTATHLGVLWRLVILDAAEAGIDAVPMAVSQAARCFEGKLPIAFLEQLLADWPQQELSSGQRARLRVQLCDRAFEAGYELRELIAMGEAAPALGSALGTTNPDALAQLRLLWALRPSRSWDACGPCATAFELASDPHNDRHFGAFPDLLFVPWDLPDGYVGSRGVFFRDIMFGFMPRAMTVRPRIFLPGGGFDLLIDDDRFWFQTDPEPIRQTLDRWFNFYFLEFRPQVKAVHEWRSPGLLDAMRLHQIVQCPECQRKLLSRLGNTGIAI